LGDTIAVAGKGGTGKTTVSSLIVSKLLADDRTPILAVDADPNANLNEWLGVEIVSTLGDLQADLVQKSREEIPAGMDKRRFLHYHMQTCLAEESGFDLIAMGRSEGPGCYCHVNDILRDFLEELTPNYRYVVMDNEAGMEHMSRRTARDVQILFVVSDGSPIGIRAAKRINELRESLEINVEQAYLLLNRATEEIAEALKDEIAESGLELLATIPTDANLTEFSLQRRPLMELADDSPAKAAVYGALERVLI